MSDNIKYFYMRLKENFFESEEMKILESVPDGYLYQNILLKLYCLSLKTEGRLMFRDTIPYNPQMIATITRHSVGIVEKALEILSQMGLVEILDNGAIYMLEIQSLIGHSSTEADRKKEYRKRIEDEKVGHLSDICPDICPHNKYIYNNIYNNNINNNLKKKKLNKEKEKHKYGQYDNVMFTDEEYAKLVEEFPEDYKERIERLSEYIESKGAKYKNHLATIRAWARKEPKKGDKFGWLDEIARGEQ